jgi:tetratricopeptide (TPR) repeat protein
MKRAIILAIMLILPGIVIGQTILIQKGITDARAMLSLGDYLLKNGYEEGALAAYEKGLSLDPQEKGILNNLGFYYREKNPLLAEDYFKKAIDVDEDYDTARQNLAVLYSKNQEYSKAIKEFSVLVLKHPENKTYTYDLAINYANRYYHVSKEYSDLTSSHGPLQEGLPDGS